MESFFLRVCLIVGVLFVFGGIACAQTQSNGRNQQQTIFDENNPIAHPLSVPADVVKILLQRKEVKDSLNSARGVTQADAVRLFRATEVYLGRPNETDLLIAGTLPVTGADNDWYWVVRSTPNPKVLLWVGCLSIELLKRATNGYCDINSSWSSANHGWDDIYRFDGSMYTLWKRTTEDYMIPGSHKTHTSYPALH